jgi:hypothetical protein
MPVVPWIHGMMPCITDISFEEKEEASYRSDLFLPDVLWVAADTKYYHISQNIMRLCISKVFT